MKFSTFTYYADQIDAASADTRKIQLLAKAFDAAGDDLAIAARFYQGSIFPDWDGRKVAIGPKLMYKVLAEAADTTPATVEDTVADVGDTGLACEAIGIEGDAGQQTLGAVGSTETITLARVDARLAEIAEMSGSGSQARKIDALSDLLLSLQADTVEGETIAAADQAKYLTRLVLDEMRIGVGQGTVRDAIAEAFAVPTDHVERAIMVTADAGVVAETARDDGATALDEMEMVVGRPVEAMLAQAGEAEDAITDWGEAVVEYKYDGARLQLQKDGDDVWLFTRGLEDETASLPDVVEVVRDHVDAETAILDAEVVAYESEDDDEPLPFTEVMKRLGRKHDIDETREEISVDVHVFDALYKDGDTLITDPLTDRLDVVAETCPELAAESVVAEDVEDIKEVEARALADGNEGVMLKKPDSPYSPGKRGQNWLKLKPDVETLDCVVVGGEMGEGRRQGLIGSYMLAVRDTDEGDLKTVGKVATGLTDAKLEELTERFEPLIEAQDGKDLQIQPELVFEVGYEELYESPEYTSGYGLRFPRFLGVREDKRVEDADTVERVTRLADD